jgi:MoxR-like ATPase
MEFINFGDLVNIVNVALGEFCNEFGRIRKELVGLGKVPKRGVLFAYNVAKNYDWSINEGGGIELQYHISFDTNDLIIKYGLGFNTQYVPFANQKPMVDYMQPYMDGFLKNQNQIRQILKDYDFVSGNIEQLKHPKHDEYTLFGKTVSAEKTTNGYIIEDSIFENIIEDLKKQIEPYQIIFAETKNYKKIPMNIQDSIKLLIQKGQIILQGPPGTGKTFTAKDIAEQIVFSKISDDKKLQKALLESTDRFKLIQFHPAYSYEDFVRGIVAESQGTHINYTAKNKVLASFAKQAYENWLASTNNPEVISKDEWFNSQLKNYIAKVEKELNHKRKYMLINSKSFIKQILSDKFICSSEEYSNNAKGFEITFIDLMEYFFSAIIDESNNISHIPNYRTNWKLIKPLLEDLRASFNEIPDNLDNQVEENIQLNYVLIIDEINRANLPAVLGELIYALEYRGEKVESMYSIDDDNTIVIPPNLYIIGTMNTSDRSVGHIDYAIRRRFGFIDILPKVLEGDDFELELFKKISALFIGNFDEYVINNGVELRLSEHLSEEFRPEDVWLGHSYFIRGTGDFTLRKKYEIVPILKEYVKDGILKQSAVPIINSL